MNTFQIQCLNTEPLEFTDIDEPDPDCLFEEYGQHDDLVLIKPSLLQLYDAFSDAELALKQDGDNFRIYTKVEDQYRSTQWIVINFIRFKLGYNRGIEYTNMTLERRKGLDHDLFLNPVGLISMLGMETIAQYGYVYGVMETVGYNIQGYPSIDELKRIVIERMGVFVSNIQFISDLESSTTLFDFVSLNDGFMEFTPSKSQPLDGDFEDNIIVLLYGNTLSVEGSLITSYEGISDYNSGILHSRQLPDDALEDSILQLIQPTLFRLGVASGMVSRVFRVSYDMPTISQLEEYLPEQ